MNFIRYSHTVKWQKYGVFRCRCDKEFVARVSAVKYGNTRSCGCSSGEKHGLSHRIPEYNVWSHMKRRCLNRRNISWSSYGGRGITICDRWRRSFLSFLQDVGRRPGRTYSIDRINNDGNYEPGNVRWATKKQQANNRRRRSCWKKPK